MTDYLDLLLRFPSRDYAIAAGIERAVTDEETEETAAIGPDGVNYHVIGEHTYASGPEEGAEILTAPGWWVLVRGPAGYPVPPEVQPLVVEPDPGNPAIPNRVWA